MMFDIITIFLVGIFLLFAVYTAIQFLGKFPQRTIDDVAPYLRPAESGELEALLDPGRKRISECECRPRSLRRGSAGESICCANTCCECPITRWC